MMGLVSRRQLQKILGVGRTTVYRQVAAGLYPAVKVGRQYRFDTEAVFKALHNHSVEVTKEVKESLKASGFGCSIGTDLAPGESEKDESGAA